MLEASMCCLQETNVNRKLWFVTNGSFQPLPMQRRLKEGAGECMRIASSCLHKPCLVMMSNWVFMF